MLRFRLLSLWMQPGQWDHRGYIVPSRPSRSRARYPHGDVLSKWVPRKMGLCMVRLLMSCPMLFPSSGQAPLAQPHLVRTTERHLGFSGKERIETEKPKQADRLTGGDTGNLWHSRTEHRHGSVPSPPDETP